MTDYRANLPIAIPISMFFVFIALTFLIGFLIKTKRAMYWSLGNSLLLGVSFLISMFCSEPFARFISGFFPNYINASPDAIYEIALPLAPLILYLIVIVAGNLIILTPLYFLLFKKILGVGKFNKNKKTTLGKNLGSRFAGGLINTALLLPISMISSNATFAFTSTQENITQDKFASNLCNFTEYFTDVFGYWKEPLPSYSDSLFAMLILTSSSNGQKAPIDEFKDSIAHSFSENADPQQIIGEWNQVASQYGDDLTLALSSDALTDAMITEMKTGGFFDAIIVGDLASFENVYNQLKSQSITKVPGKNTSVNKIEQFVVDELKTKFPENQHNDLSQITKDIMDLFFQKI